MCGAAAATLPLASTAALILLAGCSPVPAPPAAALRPIDGAAFQDLVRDAQGRPLVVNFWATWCEPCRQEIPALQALHVERGGKVRVVGVSVDDPGREEVVRRFLASQGVSFPQYIRSDSDDESFIAAVDPEWNGAVPATFVYDGTGRRSVRLIGQQDRESLDSALRPLLSVAPR